MNLAIAVLILLIIIPGIAAYGWIATGNRLAALETRIDTALADVDVYLKHRHNLIPGLVETVRGFASHEREILAQVTQARSAALAAAGKEGKAESEQRLSRSVTSLMSVVERYPDLKASVHFKALHDELTDAEHRITAARRFYNLAVDEYNATLRQFPGTFVAKARMMSARRPFDLGIERVLLDEPVAIKF